MFPIFRNSSSARGWASRPLLFGKVSAVVCAAFSWIATHSGRTKVQKDVLITALRSDQAGESTFPEFLADARGVVRSEVTFARRTVAYPGCNGDDYIETYPANEIS